MFLNESLFGGGRLDRKSISSWAASPRGGCSDFIANTLVQKWTDQPDNFSAINEDYAIGSSRSINNSFDSPMDLDDVAGPDLPKLQLDIEQDPDPAMDCVVIECDEGCGAFFEGKRKLVSFSLARHRRLKHHPVLEDLWSCADCGSRFNRVDNFKLYQLSCREPIRTDDYPESPGKVKRVIPMKNTHKQVSVTCPIPSAK